MMSLYKLAYSDSESEDSDDVDQLGFLECKGFYSDESGSECVGSELAQNGDPGAKGCATGDAPMETQEETILGCSDRTEDTEAAFNRRLREEVLQICAVLPQIYCRTVYEALLKNADAENRVELTIWDLLPFERPRVRLAAKRKYADANSLDTADANSLDTADANSLDTANANSLDTADSKESSKEVISEGDKAGTSGINGQPRKPAGSILQPAKLKINAETSKAIPPPSPVPIIKPARLTNIHTTGEKDAKVSRLQDTDMDGLAPTPINKYMKYLELMEDVKEHNVSGPILPDTTKGSVEPLMNFAGPSTGNDEQGAGDACSGNVDAGKPVIAPAKRKKTKRKKGKQKDDSMVIEPSIDEASGTSGPVRSTVNSGKSKPECSTSDFTPKLSTSKENGPIANDESADFELARSLQEGECLGALFWQNSTGQDTQNLTDTCTLLSKMFPDVEMAYIVKLYEGSLYDDTEYSSEVERTQALVDELLVRTGPKIVLDETECEIDRQYSYLMTVFPNADPSYMMKVAKMLYKNIESVEDFIEEQLENPNYPTREQYIENKRIAKEQKVYTSFNVQQFLEMFPEPFRHFEDPNRKCTTSQDALDFLAHQFSYAQVSVDFIEDVYASKGYNLSLAFNALKKRFPGTGTNPTEDWVPTKDIALLQEIAFLVHKKEIEAYYVELNEREKRLYRELKMNDRLIECGCCYNECIPSKCSCCDKGHIFCNTCIQEGTEVSLGEGQARIGCFEDCDGEFSLAVLKRILRPERFSILLKKRQEQEVNAAGLEGLVSCPFCSFASIPPPEDKVFKCLNPECMKETCRNCKELNHLPQRCYEERTERARLFLEEKMTEALVRKCRQCQRPYIKEEGCNKITCPCGTISCYICDCAVTNYDHFAGQGTAATNRCPLFSDDLRLNNQVVREVAEKTVDFLKQKDPKIELNATGLLPNVPKPSYGPHEYVPNQNAFLKHRLEQVATFETAE